MQQIGIEVLLIFILLFINGLFSMSEIAVVSAKKVRLQKRAEEGNLGAKAALDLAETPNRFLSTVQIGITLVGVLSGAFGGAALAVHLVPYVEQIVFLKPYANEVSFSFVVLLITYFSLVIGELVPKRIGLNAPERIAAIMSRPMSFISKLTAPVVWLLSVSTNTVLKLLRQSKSADSAVTEDEIKAILVQGKTEGIIEETEQELMENVIRLDDQSITALMTPRTKVVWLDLQGKSSEIREQILKSQFSRLLVVKGDLDNIQGFVESKDIVNLILTESLSSLQRIIKKPLFIPETSTALEVLEKFRYSQSHFGVIIDEFGFMQGIITTDDLLEAIIGDLTFGVRNENAVQRSDGSWLLDARLSNSDYSLILKIKELPTDEIGVYETLAGFVIKRLEKLPEIGDKFVWQGYTFEVVDMDGKRVDQVLVYPPKNQKKSKHNLKKK